MAKRKDVKSEKKSEHDGRRVSKRRQSDRRTSSSHKEEPRQEPLDGAPLNLEDCLTTEKNLTLDAEAVHILKKDSWKKLYSCGYITELLYNFLATLKIHQVSDLNHKNLAALTDSFQRFCATATRRTTTRVEMAQLALLHYIGNTLVKNIEHSKLYLSHWIPLVENMTLLNSAPPSHANEPPYSSTIESKYPKEVELTANLSHHTLLTPEFGLPKDILKAGKKNMPSPVPENHSSEPANQSKNSILEAAKKTTGGRPLPCFSSPSPLLHRPEKMTCSPLPSPLYNPNTVALLFPPHPLHYSWRL
jgi:hypothetical protein